MRRFPISSNFAPATPIVMSRVDLQPANFVRILSASWMRFAMPFSSSFAGMVMRMRCSRNSTSSCGAPIADVATSLSTSLLPSSSWGRNVS